MRTSLACMLLSVGLLVAPARAQTVSAELDLTTPFADSTADTQSALLIVPDRSGYLVFYRDRTTPGDSMTRATRLGADGAATGDLAMQLPHAPIDAACSAAGDCAAVGVEFVMESSTYVPHLFLMRFRDDGATIDTVEIISTRRAVSEPAIELTTSGWLLTYTTSDTTGSELFRQTVPTAGALGTATSIGTGLGASMLSCRASDCLLLYRTSTYVWRGQRTGLDGTGMGAPFDVPIDTSATWNGTAMRGDGAGWTVASALAAPGRVRLDAFRVSGTGTVSAVADIGDTRATVPVFACDAAGLCLFQIVGPLGMADELVVWNGTTITDTSDAVPPLGPGSVELACVASRSCLRLEERTDSGPTTIAVQTLAFDATTTTRAPVAGFGTGPDVTSGPIAIAGSESGGLAVFTRRTGSSWSTTMDLVSTPIGAGGTPLTGPGTTLQHVLIANVTGLALAQAGTRYGLLTMGHAAGSFRVLDADGAQVVAPVVLSALADAHRIELAWNGTHYLVLYIDSSYQLKVQRLDTIGQRVDPVPIALGPAGDADVASDGTGFLVVIRSGAMVRGLLLGADAQPIDTMGFLVRDHENISPRVAFTGSEYVAAWGDQTTTTGGGFPPSMTISRVIRATRISTTGEVRDLGGVVLDALEDDHDGFTDPVLDVGGANDEAYVGWLQITSTAMNARLASFRDGAAQDSLALIDDPMVAAPQLVEVGALAVGASAAIYSRSMSDPAHAPARVRMRTFHGTASPSLPDGGTFDAGVGDDGGSVASDSGTADDGGGIALDASGTPPTPSSGCAIGGARSRLAALAGVLALAWIHGRRRRRR